MALQSCFCFGRSRREGPQTTPQRKTHGRTQCIVEQLAASLAKHWNRALSGPYASYLHTEDIAENVLPPISNYNRPFAVTRHGVSRKVALPPGSFRPDRRQANPCGYINSLAYRCHVPRAPGNVVQRSSQHVRVSRCVE